MLVLLLAGPTGAGAQDATPRIGLIRVDGAITPVMATYIDRGIDDSVDRGHSAVVLEMDTPGGLSSAMDDIISDILNSRIPVIVYVAPDGARAASAGVYIAYAAHVAAMAPATNIGSATPVQLGDDGNDDGEESTMDRKIVNDAVGKIQALAELRERNAEWAEEAVREAANIPASKAAEIGVVDFVAHDRDELLALADGRTVQVQGESVQVRTAGGLIRETDMSLFERLLQVLTDPNIAFVLLSLGSLALVFELANPGSIGPGAVGALMMITGFYALGTLDTNWAGLALIALSFLLFAIDVFVPTHGVLTVSGIVAFLLGSLLLSITRNDEVLEVSRVVIFTMTALLGAFFLFIVGSVWRIRDKPPATGTSTIVGGIGTARTILDPDGMVFMQGELWSATSTTGPIEAGSSVRVTGMRGIRLQVEPLGAEVVFPSPMAPGG
jgi:membrane-bound serine protease (ClpP class)